MTTSKSTNSSGAANVQNLFQTAHDEGNLSSSALKTLTIPDIADQINAAMGTPAVDVKASEVYLVTMLLDDSYSIKRAGNEQAVRDGANVVRQALMDSDAGLAILMCVRYVNGKVVVPFTPIDQVPLLDASNFQANGGTPFYDMTVVSLGDILAKSQEFSDRNVPVRSATLLVTDGHDEGSTRFTRPEQLLDVMRDVLMSETHIVMAMGIQDDLGTDFKDIFRRMGIQDKFSLLTTATPHDIRLNFGTFSKTAARGSQSANNFSQIAAGGFAQK